MTVAWRQRQARLRSRNASRRDGCERWRRSVTEVFLLGVHSATYPLVIAATGEIVSGDFGATEEIALAVVFVVIGSSSVAGVAALATFAAQRSAALIERMRLWLTLNNQAVVTAILEGLWHNPDLGGLQDLAL